MKSLNANHVMVDSFIERFYEWTVLREHKFFFVWRDWALKAPFTSIKSPKPYPNLHQVAISIRNEGDLLIVCQNHSRFALICHLQGSWY
jgi:hypothetical protein